MRKDSIDKVAAARSQSACLVLTLYCENVDCAGRKVVVTVKDHDGSLGKPNRPGAGIGTRTEFRSEGRVRSALGRTSRQPWVRNSLGRSPPQAARREVTRKPVFRPQADQEVQSARQWYEEQRPDSASSSPARSTRWSSASHPILSPSRSFTVRHAVPSSDDFLTASTSAC